MSTHKKIPKKTRLAVYEKCNHRCAYCGCDLKYEDMQVDHIKSVYANNDASHTMTEEEMYSGKTCFRHVGSVTFISHMVIWKLFGNH